MTRLTKNILYNLIGYITIAAMGFVAVKYVFSNLGEDVLGIIYFTSMINALILMLVDLGISATIMREISVHYKENKQYVHQLIRTAAGFFWGAFFFAGLLIYFLAPLMVKKWINLTTMSPEMAIFIIRILVISSMFALPQALYVSIYKGLQRMEYNNIITIVFTVIRQLGTIIILGLEGNLNQIIYLHALCYSLPILMYLLFGFQFFPKRAFIPGFFYSVIKKNIDFISKLTLQTIVLAVYQQLDKLIISKFLPIGILGFYSFAFSNVQRAAIMQHSIVVAAYPSLSLLFGENNMDGLMAQYRRLQSLICFGNVPFFTLIVFMLLPLFSYLFNPEVAQIMYLPTLLLCFGAYINGTLRLPYTFTTAIGKPEINVKNDFYSLIFILPIAAVLVYKYELVGAGISFILRYLFGYFYVVPRYCSECFKISVLEWYRPIIRASFATLVTYGTAYFILSIMNNFSIFALIYAYSGASVVYLGISFFLIDEELQNTIYQQIHLIKKIM